MAWIVLLIFAVAVSTATARRRVRLRARGDRPGTARSHARGRPVVDDPFVVLELQLRLSSLAGEIQRIEHDRTSLALAHHLRACQLAYDAVLLQACTLLGLDDSTTTWVTDGGHLTPESNRMHQELELCSRGWSW